MRAPTFADFKDADGATAARIASQGALSLFAAPLRRAIGRARRLCSRRTLTKIIFAGMMMNTTSWPEEGRCRHYYFDGHSEGISLHGYRAAVVSPITLRAEAAAPPSLAKPLVELNHSSRHATIFAQLIWAIEAPSGLALSLLCGDEHFSGIFYGCRDDDYGCVLLAAVLPRLMIFCRCRGCSSRHITHSRRYSSPPASAGNGFRVGHVAFTFISITSAQNKYFAFLKK